MNQQSYHETMTLNCESCDRKADLIGGLCADCRGQDLTESCRVEQPTDAPTIMPQSSGPPTESTRTETPDRTFGEYELIQEIARGGMGVVYKAKHQKLDRLAALKMILTGRFSSHEELQRFQLEAKSAASLDHPGIVPIYEISEQDGQAYFAMKYVEGGTLADHMQSYRGDNRKIVDCLSRVADAVGHAHQRGILHRDLKPANILLDENSDPMVSDFGLAKSTTGGSNLTNTGAVVGTPSYMPREQASGGSVTTATDIYSLGAIMYEMLVGRPPFEGQSSVDVLLKLLDSPVDPPHKIDPEVDRDLELICMKCLEHEPGSRYRSASELRDDLDAWSEGRTISVKPPSLIDLVKRWGKQNQKLVYVGFALVIGILLCLIPILGFLSSNTGEVYSRFPDRKPLLFSIVQLPRWTVEVLAFILFFALWPAIGLLNDVVTRASSIWRSFLTGAGTAIAMGFIFYVSVGWLIFLSNARNHSNQKVYTLAKAVWSSEESGHADAVEKANQIYNGLDQIPENERPEIVRERFEADIFASATTGFFVCLAVCVVAAIPIIYGTMIACRIRLARPRRKWLAIIRYLIAWWSISCFLITGIASMGKEDEEFVIQRYWLAFLICFVVFYGIAHLTLRNWGRKREPLAVAEPQA